MHFWDYLKKQEPSREYEEAKIRISRLHEQEENMSYINQMYALENGVGEMLVEFVKGEHLKGEKGELFDAQGKKSGEIQIQELLIGENENPGIRSEGGEKGKIVFEYEEAGTSNFWRSQYLRTKKIRKIPKNC